MVGDDKGSGRGFVPVEGFLISGLHRSVRFEREVAIGKGCVEVQPRCVGRILTLVRLGEVEIIGLVRCADQVPKKRVDAPDGSAVPFPIYIQHRVG